jgi:effector-binding domain-containing protein
MSGHVLTVPKLEDRGEQPYVAIPARATMETIGPTLAPLVPEVFGWLEQQGVDPAGPPFFRYLVIDMDGELELEVGVPVATPVAGDDRLRAGSFPAGRYATAVHVGPYEGLADATGSLLAWADENGVAWDVQETGKREVWGARAEFYITNPEEEPNPERWETELAFRIAG